MGKDIEKDFMAAYDANSDALFKHIFFRVHDRELAKDLLQEVFTKVWQYISSGKQVDNMKAFLYKSAHNIVIDHYRKEKATSLDAMHEAGYDVADGRMDSKTSAEVNELVTALAKIPEDYREVVTMRYVNEMGPNEIAEILGEGAGTISVRINRGVEMLRKELKI
jgi:RNA polymerase sigma-70 factor (ECF subfamily)